MGTLVTTTDIPAADRFDFIRELTATMWVPMDCGGRCPPDYRGEFRASGLGPMQVVVLDIMPITVRRTSELISHADPNMLKLFLVCAGGTSVVDQGGRQFLLQLARHFGDGAADGVTRNRHPRRCRTLHPGRPAAGRDPRRRRLRPGPADVRRLGERTGAVNIERIRAHFAFPRAGRIVTKNAASTQPPCEFVALYRSLSSLLT